MIRPTLVALVLTATVIAPAAQSRPDFSGAWVADVPVAPVSRGSGVPAAQPQRPDTGALGRGDMGAGWGSPLTITQTDDQLVVEVRLFTNYDMQPQPRLVYALDGSESRNTVMAGHTSQMRTSRATWEGGTLKVVTRYPGVDPVTGKPFTTEVTSRLSLRSPTEMVIESARSGALGGQPTTGSTTYRKK